MIKRISVITALSLFCLLLPGVAFAQSATPTPKATPAVTSSPQPSASPAPSLKEQMAALRQTYRGQLATYRTDEKQYQIAKEQYLQLQTLASLEEALKATRKAMISRSDLLETYFTMLKVTLIETKGIDLATKTSQIEKIDNTIGELKQHRLQVEKALDRTQILAVQASFSKLLPQIEESTYKTLMLITYGNAQSMYDKTLAVTRELADEMDKTEKNPLVLAEKRRGFEEIGRTLSQVDQQLKDINTRINEDRDHYTENDFNAVVDSLEEVFSGLSRSVSYLGEVIKP